VRIELAARGVHAAPVGETALAVVTVFMAELGMRLVMMGRERALPRHGPQRNSLQDCAFNRVGAAGFDASGGVSRRRRR
jgi:hypothetical protein